MIYGDGQETYAGGWSNDCFDGTGVAHLSPTCFVEGAMVHEFLSKFISCEIAFTHGLYRELSLILGSLTLLKRCATGSFEAGLADGHCKIKYPKLQTTQ